MEEMSAISDLISSGHAVNQSPEDEAALEAELDALMREGAAAEPVHTAAQTLPSAPSTAPVAVKRGGEVAGEEVRSQTQLA
jgi:hypothetical protein